MEIMKANREWATRPDDQRFVSLTDLHDHVTLSYKSSASKVLDIASLRARACEDDAEGKSLEIVGEKGNPASISNWAFNQLSVKGNFPAGYIQSLPAKLAADNINHGLSTIDSDQIGMLVSKSDSDGLMIKAVTGPKYGRIWNHEITKPLVDRFGNGMDGDWRVPGIFGNELTEVTKANTTIYGSDRDMFVFLADERNRIEMPNRRDGKAGSLARGFMVWNSEVGAATLGIAFFMFDYVCSNRIIWGAKDYKEIKIRHTLNAPEIWQETIAPAIESYGNSKASEYEQTLLAAQSKSVLDYGDSVEEFFKKKLNLPSVPTKLINNIKIAHEAAEQRPIRTVWDSVTAVTEYAKTIPFQNERVTLERAGGKLLELVAN